ncbi:Cytochrome b-c1 complex subunit Rieske, mitochondrial [Zancudomyces culisetae]|uniref:Cytochrome b-c1 complex subunit Rieske, mitochondrial n=1 Tax=Zancudomyces culisetae TaxID=1213189 RepID=A0A1R1PLL3_ZANCU|nr:Cytochrome b-c1 complex subunit Rieske, mitochondrial [Zancudomyces culisetae]|eukprot:OMH81823.1 Cytochrome b-c1 complex subunit Rieske, mitochondrial [Zancudomyces culisetae]
MNFSKVLSNKTFYTAPATKQLFKSAFPNSGKVVDVNNTSNSQITFGGKKNMLNATKYTVAQRRYGSYASGPGSSKVPSFGGYAKSDAEGSTDRSRVFSYFMLGATGAVVTAAAQNSVHEFLVNMAASADVLAVSKIEVDLAKIPVGSSVTLKWRGKPVFVRHRTQEQIELSRSVNVASLIDPQNDADRVKIPEWLVVVGICTHLGCVPIKDSGEFGAYYCPCHGSHYDYSGRIRKGPAPLNLEVPDYSIDGNILTVG